MYRVFKCTLTRQLYANSIYTNSHRQIQINGYATKHRFPRKMSSPERDTTASQRITVRFMPPGTACNLRKTVQQILDGSGKVDECIERVREEAGYKEVGVATALRGALDSKPPELSTFILQMCLNGVDRWAERAGEVLQQGDVHELTFTRREICELLAMGVCGFASESKKGNEDTDTMPRFDFLYIASSKRRKLECLIAYFERMQSTIAHCGEEELSVIRQGVNIPSSEADRDSFWRCNEQRLSEVVVDAGVIEEKHGMLQADFANQYLGGGVLWDGNVQEEIRFMICPELLVLMPFCEAMVDNESLLIIGATQYVSYRGYGKSFECTGPINDPAPLDSQNRRDVHIIAYDALCFPGSWQYDADGVQRELWKCLAAFTPRAGDDRPIATGNWGCGCFGGDPHLKFLIQWLAASHYGRKLVYHPYTDKRVKRLAEEVRAFSENNPNCTVGRLYAKLIADPEEAYANIMQ
eukprot:GEMP01039538.1.p1 GENE.GEMP01039538.1~~GEMP01039538.1.p1  ORF type:complete len:468 (+),score=67.46 GEMP01039538.1:116-1519(+)